jgi:hypothetical protein
MVWPAPSTRCTLHQRMGEMYQTCLCGGVGHHGDMPRLGPCGITPVLPVCELPDGTGVVDQSVKTPSLFNAGLNEAREIPTTGEVRLHRHGLDALVKNRSNWLTCALVDVAVVPRYVRALLAQSPSHGLADAAICTGHTCVEASPPLFRHLSTARPRR